MSSTRRRIAPLVLFAPVLPVLAACGQTGAGAVPRTRLPPYASRSPAALAGYRFAVAQPGLLAQLPCYCNCGRTAGHQSLRDCFVSATGTFTDHAAYCEICQEEALDAKRLHAAGTGVPEIRRFVDATYAGRGTPTTTPPVGG
jgi:hypothetical protein